MAGPERLPPRDSLAEGQAATEEGVCAEARLLPARGFLPPAPT